MEAGEFKVTSAEIELHELQDRRPPRANLSGSAKAVVVRNSSFGWMRDAEPVLRNINLNHSTVETDHDNRASCLWEVDTTESKLEYWQT